MEEKQLRRRFLTAAVLVAVAAALLVGGVATYAWFTSNQRVNTSRVEARTGDESFSLLVSSTGGDDFRGAEEAAITHVNESDAEYLIPVSTADLVTFLTATGYNSEGMPTAYTPVKNEADYYHGRIWLKAEASGRTTGSRVALYLDQSAGAGGLLAQKDEDNSMLLNAARLGLVLEDGDSVIFYLSDERNPDDQRQRNTVLGGALQEEGIVLRASGDSVSAVDDPAVPVSSRAVGPDGALGTPLGYLEFDRIYVLDIYFYLEGCDPDCWDPIAFDGSDLHLAFYGALS